LSKTIFFIFLSNALFAGTITIRATVAATATLQTKATYADFNIMKQDIYLKTNHKGLSIALTDNSYGSSNLMNQMPLSTIPLTLSNKIYTKPTKVGELLISQHENRGSLGITISVRL